MFTNSPKNEKLVDMFLSLQLIINMNKFHEDSNLED
jgi:hypothetical protein